MLERGSGTILLTGGAFATRPHPDYLSLRISKAGIRNLTYGIFDRFKDRGVHVAVPWLRWFRPTLPRRAVAQAFWDLYAQPRQNWTPEATYPG